MTPSEAKRILWFYRPGSADDGDGEFCEALRLCQSDPELGLWLEEHCATYAALQAKFRQVLVPEGLKEQILSERKAHTMPKLRRPGFIAAAFAAFILLAGLALFWMRSGETSEFATYRVRMTSIARRTYGMELETANPAEVRSFLAQRHAASDYSLPAGLQKAQVVGCTAAMSWRGHTVAMICFKSGRLLPAGQGTDLWLLITEDATVSGVPSSLPTLAQVNGAATASWKEGNKLYLLIGEGDEKFLRQYL
jgi:hypothetical protein